MLSFFEAARWAPSAYNAQPWRFLFALRGTPAFDRYLSLLIEFNQGWAKHAAALVVIVSKTTFAAPGSTEEKPAPTHAFDTGAAWGHLALQAHLSGWHTHGMSGLDFERARQELKIPEGYQVQQVIQFGSNLQGVLERRDADALSVLQQTRSEERRVGKECRSRWSPYH